MGGHAFKNLHCPRIPPEVYAKIKHVTTLALQTIFTHVTVPFEVPGKVDYGDIDFLVCAPFRDSTELTLSTFPFQPVIDSVKRALDTTHGRRGFLTPDCIYFAIPLPADVPTICIEDEDEDRKGGKVMGAGRRQDLFQAGDVLMDDFRAQLRQPVQHLGQHDQAAWFDTRSGRVAHTSRRDGSLKLGGKYSVCHQRSLAGKSRFGIRKKSH